MSSAFVVGFGLGALVAAQLGPISLLLIRTVMRGAIASGLAIGCAVAIVDTLYATLGVAGAAPFQVNIISFAGNFSGIISDE